MINKEKVNTITSDITKRFLTEDYIHARKKGLKINPNSIKNIGWIFKKSKGEIDYYNSGSLMNGATCYLTHNKVDDQIEISGIYKDGVEFYNKSRITSKSLLEGKMYELGLGYKHSVIGATMEDSYLEYLLMFSNTHDKDFNLMFYYNKCFYIGNLKDNENNYLIYGLGDINHWEIVNFAAEYNMDYELALDELQDNYIIRFNRLLKIGYFKEESYKVINNFIISSTTKENTSLRFFRKEELIKQIEKYNNE